MFAQTARPSRSLLSRDILGVRDEIDRQTDKQVCRDRDIERQRAERNEREADMHHLRDRKERDRDHDEQRGLPSKTVEAALHRARRA